MIGRVTQSMMSDQLLGNVRTLQRRLLNAQDVLSSGKTLRQASDDPAGAALVNGLRAQSADLNSLSRTIGFGRSVLTAQDDALDQANNIMTRAKEIASQQAGTLATPTSRQQAAEEVDALERQLIALGNTAIDGRHVFGGLASGTAPFTDLDDPGFDPLNPYAGPTDAFSIRTAPDTTVRLTTPGDQVFGSSIAALDSLKQTLAAGNSSTANIDPLETAAADVRAERTSVGGRARQLEDRASEITNGVSKITARLGDIEGADYATVITELTQLQTALQATLSSGQILQTSILDYLNL
jgi:flagellar hook-associated protein 3 FlgL